MTPNYLLCVVVLLLICNSSLASGQENPRSFAKDDNPEIEWIGYLEFDFARKYMDFSEAQEKKFTKSISEYKKNLDRIESNDILTSDQKYNQRTLLTTNWSKSIWKEVLISRQQKQLKHLPLYMKITFYGFSYTITHGYLAEE